MVNIVLLLFLRNREFIDVLKGLGDAELNKLNGMAGLLIHTIDPSFMWGGSFLDAIGKPTCHPPEGDYFITRSGFEPNMVPILIES